MAAWFDRRIDEIRGVVPFDRHSLRSFTLPRASRFIPHQLAEHLSEYPDLAYRATDRAEYVVGGLWRRREEIGLIVELVGSARKTDLLAAICDAYRNRHCEMVIVDPREHGRSLRFYREHGFVVVDTLVQMERRDLDAPPPSEPWIIRPMGDGDLATVLEVERHSFPFLWWNSGAELLWYASVTGVHLFVAMAADQPSRVVGYAGFTILDREAHLDRLAVHRDYQRQGYGAALLAFSLDQMRWQGARRVALTTQLDNTHSQALYKRFNFRYSGWQQDILGRQL